jgi:phenylalanyl-tRNA synthetase beta chain
VKRIGGQATEVCNNYIGCKIAEPIQVSIDNINSLLGTNYDINLITTTLENVGISCKQDDQSKLTVLAPYWRTDLHIKEDIIEEVGRLLGYDNISIDYPKRPFIGAEISPILSLKTKIRNVLSDKLNANEVLTYSFISEKLMAAVDQKIDSSYKIVNSISPELQCFRQHIAPSLIDKVRENTKSGHNNFTLYELNQISSKEFGLDEDNAPITKDHLAILTFGDFYKVKSIINSLCKNLNISILVKNFIHQEEFTYLEPLHSADIFVGEKYIGSFGEVKQSVLGKFKLDAKISVSEIDLANLLGQEKIGNKNLKVSKFPFVYRDITVKVDSNKGFAELNSSIESVLKENSLIYKVEPSSIYQPENTSNSKNISFHIAFSNSQKTLQPNDISAIMEQINKALQTLGAEVV